MLNPPGWSCRHPFVDGMLNLLCTNEKTIEFDALDALPLLTTRTILRGHSRANRPLAVKNVGSNLS
jgi:hypothetical protein